MMIAIYVLCKNFILILKWLLSHKSQIICFFKYVNSYSVLNSPYNYTQQRYTSFILHSASPIIDKNLPHPSLHNFRKYDINQSFKSNPNLYQSKRIKEFTSKLKLSASETVHTPRLGGHVRSPSASFDSDPPRCLASRHAVSPSYSYKKLLKPLATPLKKLDHALEHSRAYLTH